MKKSYSYLLALVISLTGLQAANLTYSATASTSDWFTASNWNNNAVPVTGDSVYISNDKSVLLAGTEETPYSLTINGFRLGAYTTTVGYGVLTLSYANLTAGALTSGLMSNGAPQTTGQSALYITNHSSLALTGTSNLGYYDSQTSDTPSLRQSFLLQVDGTSSISSALFNIGRGTSATLSLLAGAKAYMTRPVFSNTQAGSSGYLYMGTGSQLNALTLTALINSTLSINGGTITTTGSSTLAAGSHIFLTSGSAILGGTVSAGGTNGTVSGAAFTIMASGAPEDFTAVQMSTLNAVATGVTITLDLSGYTGGSYELTLITANLVQNESNIAYSTTGAAEGTTVDFNWVPDGDKTSLVASITAIPEPAVSAAVLGALALAAVSRRRKRA